MWWATAFASIVFPVPGGPYISTPRGGSIPDGKRRRLSARKTEPEGGEAARAQHNTGEGERGRPRHMCASAAFPCRCGCPSLWLALALCHAPRPPLRAAAVLYSMQVGHKDLSCTLLQL